MTFSMVKMKNIETDEVNVIWTNSESSTIDFSEQTDEVMIFTDTNTYGDLVRLNGDYNDTIHVGDDDSIYSGSGDDLILGWNSTNILILDEIPKSMTVIDKQYLIDRGDSMITLVSDNGFESTDVINIAVNRIDDVIICSELNIGLTLGQHFNDTMDLESVYATKFDDNN